jgi:integrase
VQDIPALVESLSGSRLRVPAMVALFTGMRLSEVLALRWHRVDLEDKLIKVREALEQTKAYGIRSKLPKSKAGRRDITLP